MIHDYAVIQVALKLVPERTKFMAVLGEGGGDLEVDMKSFVANFSPLLQENHEFLVSNIPIKLVSLFLLKSDEMIYTAEKCGA